MRGGEAPAVEALAIGGVRVGLKGGDAPGAIPAGAHGALIGALALRMQAMRGAPAQHGVEEIAERIGLCGRRMHREAEQREDHRNGEQRAAEDWRRDEMVQCLAP